MRLTRLEGQAQRLARPQQMRLAGKVIQPGRAHALGQRHRDRCRGGRRRLFAEQIVDHGLARLADQLGAGRWYETEQGLRQIRIDLELLKLQLGALSEAVAQAHTLQPAID